MTIQPLIRCGIAAICLLCVSSLTAATIKLKSGTVHEGRITGLIVLKGQNKESQSEKNPGKTTYTASYAVINGSDITAIDEQGVHQTGGRAVGMMVASQDGAPLEDLDTVHTGINLTPGPFSIGYTKAGGSVIRVGGRSGQAVITRDQVLGEYRENREKKDAEIRPVLEIETAVGIVKVPVAELAELKPTE